jgi:hypothetical protein
MRVSEGLPGLLPIDMIINLFLILVGACFLIGAFSKETKLRSAFSFGTGPSFPISRVGRIVLFFIGVVAVVRGIVELLGF